MHISFKFPKGDKCSDCQSFEQKITEGEDENVLPAYELHKTKAKKAILRYQEDAEKMNS